MLVEELAKKLHERYEELAVEVGWSTQEKCRVPFDELPEKNKLVMLKLAEWIKDNLLGDSK